MRAYMCVKNRKRTQKARLELPWCPGWNIIITPRAHARARGCVIGRGVYYILYYISAKLFSIFQNTHFQRSILTQIGFSSNLMASGTA